MTDSTHVLGNTLNLICTNQPNIMLCDAEIIISGFSDHSVIVAHLRNSTTSPPNQPHTIRLYRKADQNAFQKDMQGLLEALSEMKDPEAMWKFYTRTHKRRYQPT